MASGDEMRNQSVDASGPGPAAASPADQASVEDADLRDSLAGLSRLVLPKGEQGLEAMLGSVAEFAVQAIPGANGASLTLLDGDRPDRPDTVVATAEIVRQVDAIQYGIGEGPCIAAVAQGRTVRSGSLSGDPAWSMRSRRTSMAFLPCLRRRCRRDEVIGDLSRR
jgi:hypothetical protein